MIIMGRQGKIWGEKLMSRIKGTPALSVDLPPALHKILKKYAKENDRTIAQIIRELVRNFVANLPVSKASPPSK